MKKKRLTNFKTEKETILYAENRQSREDIQLCIYSVKPN